MLTSIKGILIFAVVMILIYRYANGNWQVSENKESDYVTWVVGYGKTIKKAVVVISIIYGISMLTQLTNLL